MLVRDGDDELEIVAVEQLPRDVRCSGDTRFHVRASVASGGTSFSADTCAWVSAPVLSKFVEQLKSLDEARDGSAVLESMSPDELRLEIRPYDKSAHMAAFGQIGHWCYSDTTGRHWSVVTFGIPFCPSELPKLVQEFRNILEVGPSAAVNE